MRRNIDVLLWIFTLTGALSEYLFQIHDIGILIMRLIYALECVKQTRDVAFNKTMRIEIVEVGNLYGLRWRRMLEMLSCIMEMFAVEWLALERFRG